MTMIKNIDSIDNNIENTKVKRKLPVENYEEFARIVLSEPKVKDGILEAARRFKVPSHKCRILWYNVRFKPIKDKVMNEMEIHSRNNSIRGRVREKEEEEYVVVKEESESVREGYKEDIKKAIFDHCNNNTNNNNYHQEEEEYNGENENKTIIAEDIQVTTNIITKYVNDLTNRAISYEIENIKISQDHKNLEKEYKNLEKEYNELKEQYNNMKEEYEILMRLISKASSFSK